MFGKTSGAPNVLDQRLSLRRDVARRVDGDGAIVEEFGGDTLRVGGEPAEEKDSQRTKPSGAQ